MKNKYGRGQLRMGNKYPIASRIAYELYVGPIPKGHNVLHECDNPSCVRPSHLFTGTQKDNTLDSMKKGRFSIPAGEKNGRAIVTEVIVLELRRRHRKWCPQNGTKALAIEFGLTTDRVQQIVNRRQWKHI